MRSGRLPHNAGICQRWRDGRPSWRHRRHGGFDRHRYQLISLPEQQARAFTMRHHYAASWPATRLRYGMLDLADGSLCGVLVLGIPMHPAVLTRPFPDLVPYQQSLELCRLVLLDEVDVNGESWFTTQALRRAADTGVRGIVAHADPQPRYRSTPSGLICVKRGHYGIIYQACSAVYAGRTTARTQIMLPDATVLTARSAAKVIAGERGARSVIGRLVELGAQPPETEQPRLWLDQALAAIGAQRQRHSGNHRYLMAVGARRRRTVIAMPALPYPKPPPRT